MNIAILGTRGIPARHGGFETFAEHFALYLVNCGHSVTVYCQVDRLDEEAEDSWRGVNLVHLYAPQGAFGTIAFDWKAMRHAAARPALILTLGYNTAIFSLSYKFRGRTSLMNMDGIEWAREKWTLPERLWLRINEYLGAKCSTHLVADHPEIYKHLEGLVPKSKITMIPYGAPKIVSADADRLGAFNCQPHRYAISIARPEPENSTLDIVRAFSRKHRGYSLVVLGDFKPKQNDYHRRVIESASSEVVFPGAIYDTDDVNALRFYARFYVHGHRVGGTNPSLVEALGAGNAVVAHRNRFNLWVAGPDAAFFDNEEDLSTTFTELANAEDRLSAMRRASIRRHEELFTLERVNAAYETLLRRFAKL
jgi:glycosyltransferase involved in cell wall biosynthesis